MLLKISKRDSLKGDGRHNLEDLWVQVRQKNSDALSTLFCVTYPRLFNYGYKIVPTEEFVKDAIQELFLNIWKSQNAISKANSVISYLFASLRRVIFRRLTKRKNRKERNRTFHRDTFKKLYNVEELIIHFETHEEKQDKIELAIGSLSDRQKEAIYLKFYGGLSNTEISDVMDINKQSVYNHVSKAIKKMQQFVEV